MKILTILGTRPEAIKLAPLIKEFEKDQSFYSVVCATSQHREMQNDILDLFDIVPHYDLNLMKKNQDLCYLTGKIIEKVSTILKKESPDICVVQGDTNTAFAGALSSFYHRIPIVHIEAGLRTSNIYSPFPEEANRLLIARIASLHIAPTQIAADNLKSENIVNNVFNIGNTIVDSVNWILTNSKIKNNDIEKIINNKNPKVLITIHRRENFGQPLLEIIEAIKFICNEYPGITFVWPVHPNPNIKDVVLRAFEWVKNLIIIEPLSYQSMIYLIEHSKLILSDSGGIQEESMILQKPIIVLRDETERSEVIDSGMGYLVGSKMERIIEMFAKLISDNREVAFGNNDIYGTPGVSSKILKIIKKVYEVGDLCNLSN